MFVKAVQTKASFEILKLEMRNLEWGVGEEEEEEEERTEESSTRGGFQISSSMT